MMKVINRGATLTCVLAAVAACSPQDGSPDAGTKGGTNSPDSGRISFVDAGCTPTMAFVALGPKCGACVNSNCKDQLASCSFNNCVDCLLQCTACTSDCSTSNANSGTGGDGGIPSDSGGGASAEDGGGLPSGSDGGAPSCEKLRNGSCCNIVDMLKKYVDLGELGAQCQQLIDTNNDGLCGSLLQQFNQFGLCK